jgi:hypothetical protein
VKRTALTTLIVLLLLGATVAVVWADKPTGFDANGNEVAWERTAATEQCTRIQDGTLEASTGELLTTGYDQFGYNYQGHMFNGRYCDYDRVIGGDYCDVELIMKWNDAWLSNVDCDGDGLLDRHYGFDSYIGSGAWETNHQSGTYALDDGTTCHWTYFVKIIAAPDDAFCDLYDLQGRCIGYWHAADGTEIGPAIWGSFAIIQQVYNDPCGGYHGIEYLSPDHAGFGGW